MGKNCLQFWIVIQDGKLLKPTSNKTQITNEKGQLSIFLGIALVIVFTSIAFVVNVGLFVKAKINLQNATDAAAWSGASVQARQLSNMAYLNWEMRNVYKEWMFKYYVLGQLGLPKTRTPSGTNMDFTLRQFFDNPSDTQFFDPSEFDPYNVPSICIHFGSPHNICEVYDVPGLPRFETPGLPSIAEQHEAFLDAIVTQKAKDCSVRSDLNFSTVMQWAYGTDVKTFAGAPQVASNRIGAWPAALELAIRMRNLEMITNLPPIPTPICLQGSGGCSTVNTLNPSPEDPVMGNMFERPVKAFWAAMRNLGGGDLKNQDELAANFKITELKPNPFSAPASSLSSFLIPNVEIPGSGGVTATEKSYVDLQAIPLNLVTFYTAFVTSNKKFSNTSTIQSEAACGGTKMALPVPGYILGFTKNPEVMTYYSVKSETKFVGMFYPFTDRSGVTLEAYASAKPFGGRIGPRLFGFGTGGSNVIARPDTRQQRSSAYISGLDTINFSTGFKPGLPIPLGTNFWVRSASDILGGVPGAASGVKFGVPNLIYDFNSPAQIRDMATGGQFIHTINNRASFNSPPAENRGLYNTNQFLSLSSNLPALGPGVIMTPPQVEAAMEGVRKPTKYDLINYMVPTKSTSLTDGAYNLTTMPTITKDVSISPVTGIGRYQLFAPLFGTNTLYKEVASITNEVSTYITANSSAIQVYLDELGSVADAIRASQTGVKTAASYQEAANTIHTPGLPTAPCDKISMAAKFNQFFNGTSTECGIDPITDKMRQYFERKTGDDPNFSIFSTFSYHNRDGHSAQTLSSAYLPGTRQGAGPNGEAFSPLGVDITNSLHHRNHYSVKFFATEKVMQSGSFPYDQPSPYMEHQNMEEPSDLSSTQIRNKLPSSELDGFGTISH
jgi:hypothetical protein